MEGVRPGVRLDPDLRRRGGVTAASWHLALQPRGWWFPLSAEDGSPPAQAVRTLRAAVERVAVTEGALRDAAAPVSWSTRDVSPGHLALLVVATLGVSLAAGAWSGPAAGAWVFVACTVGGPLVVLAGIGRATLLRRAARDSCQAAHDSAVQAAHRAVEEVLQAPFVACMPDGVAWCDPDESARRARVVVGRSRGAPDPEAEVDWATWDRAFARAAEEAMRSGLGGWVAPAPRDHVASTRPSAGSSPPASSLPMPAAVAEASAGEGGLDGVEPIPFEP